MNNTQIKEYITNVKIKCTTIDHYTHGIDRHIWHEIFCDVYLETTRMLETVRMNTLPVFRSGTFKK